LIKKISLSFINDKGAHVIIEISAVRAPVSSEREAVVFVDNNAKVIFGQRYFSGLDMPESMNRFANETLSAVQELYRKESEIAKRGGKEFPSVDTCMQKIKDIITVKINRSLTPNSRR
jgi:hypothetical protein